VLGIVVLDAPHVGGIVRARMHPGEHDGLIAAEARRRVDRVRVHAPILQVRSRPDDKEGVGLLHRIQPGEVEKAAVHHVEAARFERDLVEDIDLVELAIGDVDERRNVAAQIEQRIQLHRPLGRTKARSGKQRQRHVDRRDVERIGRVRQLDAEWLARVESACRGD